MTVIQRFVAWEQRKLNELTDYTDYRGKSPKKAVEGVQLITASNIRYGYIDYNADKQFVSEEDYPDIMRRGMPKIGEVLFTTEAPLGNVAQVNNENIALAQRVIKFDGKENLINNDYLFEYFLAPTFQVEINKKATGGTVKGIKGKVLHKIFINFPKTIEEQLKIGKLLKLLDETIALHQEKLSKLYALKEAYLQQMFPQYKENNPKVRFTNFGEKWQKSKLSEVLNVNSGRDYKHLKSGDVPVYGTGGYMLSVDQCLSDEDAIGIGRKGTIDKPQYLKSPFWTVDTLFYMKVKKGYDLLFVYSISQTVRWKKYDESTGVPSLSKTTINNITKTFPPYKEQVAIGKFFDKINELIDLEQIKLDKLKNLKKAYLRKMFI